MAATATGLVLASRFASLANCQLWTICLSHFFFPPARGRAACVPEQRRRRLRAIFLGFSGATQAGAVAGAGAGDVVAAAPAAF